MWKKKKLIIQKKKVSSHTQPKKKTIFKKIFQKKSKSANKKIQIQKKKNVYKIVKMCQKWMKKNLKCSGNNVEKQCICSQNIYNMPPKTKYIYTIYIYAYNFKKLLVVNCDNFKLNFHYLKVPEIWQKKKKRKFLFYRRNNKSLPKFC